MRYRVNGCQRIASLARVIEVSLREARRRAGDQLVAIRSRDDDPLERRRQQREAPTVNDAFDRFLDDFCPERIKIGRLTQRTADGYRWEAQRHVRPRLARRKVADVTRHDIEMLVAKLPYATRNHLLAVLSRVFNLCETWDWRPQHTNPVRGVEAVEEPRDRTLNSR